MTLNEVVARAKATLNGFIDQHNDLTNQINKAIEADDRKRERELRAELAPIDSKRADAEAHLRMLEAELADDERIQRAQAVTFPVPRQSEGEVREQRGGISPVAGRDLDRAAFIRTADRRPAAVTRAQRVADHPVAAEMIARTSARDAAIIGQYGSLGEQVRVMTTTGGSAIVPTVWAADVIDLARNKSAVMQAGAEVVPMDAKTVEIGRLTGDPTATFRTEGSAITPSDATLDNVELVAKTMSALVIGTVEWFADANNAEAVVENAIAQAMATQLDLVALYGGVTTGSGAGIDLASPNPTGILATLLSDASSSVLGFAANGTTQTTGSFWGEVLDTVFTPRDHNEEPNALLWNSKLQRLYAKANDTTGQPLAMPADVAALQRFTTNQIPSFDRGTMTGVATDLFVGDFTQLIIGQRMDVTLQVLDQRYADEGKIGILATWRGDIGVARPRAFSVYRAIKGA